MAHNGIPFSELGEPWNRPLAAAPPPAEVLHAEVATFGIAYDFDSHHIEDNLPGGWAKRRGAYTKRIGHISNNFLQQVFIERFLTI